MTSSFRADLGLHAADDQRLEQRMHLALLVVELGLPEQSEILDVVLGEDLLVLLPVGAAVKVASRVGAFMNFIL